LHYWINFPGISHFHEYLLLAFSQNVSLTTCCFIVFYTKEQTVTLMEITADAASYRRIKQTSAGQYSCGFSAMSTYGKLQECFDVMDPKSFYFLGAYL
jgi:hypothetical protein